MSEPLLLNLPPELAAGLARRAEATGIGAEEILLQALRRHLFEESDADHAIYISSPVNALVEGIYEENTTLADIRRHGDFGLGTFNDLDGEMVVLDGVIYQLRADGEAYRPGDSTLTPFACVNFFSPDSEEEIELSLDLPGLQEILGRMIPSPNMVYAIRIEGEFDYVKTRSVPRQQNYRPLVEVAREQPTFEFHSITGTMAGYWTPSFMESLAVPGWHLHFLTADRRHGGHLLDCRTSRVRIAVQHLPKVEVGLPVTLDYLTATFTRDMEKDLDEAER